MSEIELNIEMDFEKCLNCELPLNYCDGITRYKCGVRRGDVKKYCVMMDKKEKST